MIRKLLGTALAGVAAVGSAHAAVLAGEGQVTGADGDVLGTIVASLDTEASRTYCVRFDDDAATPSCTAEQTLTGVLDLSFVGEALEPLRRAGSASGTFFVDLDGPFTGTLLPVETPGPREPAFFFQIGEFFFGGSGGLGGQGRLVVSDFLNGTLTGAVVADGEDGLLEGADYTLTFPALTGDVVPLPAGAILFLTGAAGLAARRRFVG